MPRKRTDWSKPLYDQMLLSKSYHQNENWIWKDIWQIEIRIWKDIWQLVKQSINESTPDWYAHISK